MTRLEGAEDQSDTRRRDNVNAASPFPLAKWSPLRLLGAGNSGVKSSEGESRQNAAVGQDSGRGEVGWRSSNSPNRVQENMESEARARSNLSSEGNARELEDRGTMGKYKGS